MKFKARNRIKPKTQTSTKVKNNNIIKTYGMGLIRGYVLSLVLFLISAVLFTYTKLSEGIIPALISFVMIISVAYSAIYVSVHRKSKGWLHGAIIGVIYMVLIVALSLIFIPGFTLDKAVYYRIIICKVTGLVGGMIGINIK
ncbi:TIGR04086 family membrane protein [Serpentinicella alkaliphila]|uniref:Putative membrane protein (TIGR04086 family) n=1 Tax=Serpentinicella alkaliphila TaxID=1734049 RepID=A0A4R2TY16_9FIRM|nr:TIGR04086 family membrane protein [Serpentinicella alkaliphila]TCQ07952.1 putative membrane protein (TIGR04086 family) [Serpentinicella alkaliphila]